MCYCNADVTSPKKASCQNHSLHYLETLGNDSNENLPPQYLYAGYWVILVEMSQVTMTYIGIGIVNDGPLVSHGLNRYTIIS